MLEITKEQFLMFDEVNRIRIFKYICLNLVKFVNEEENI